MTTFHTQGPKTILSENSCHFVSLLSLQQQLEINYVIQQSTEAD